LAFLGAYTVCERVAQEHILTFPFLIAALTQAEERESHC
jgi:hypothetical protein